jgi:hypothetical protein
MNRHFPILAAAVVLVSVAGTTVVATTRTARHDSSNATQRSSTLGTGALPGRSTTPPAGTQGLGTAKPRTTGKKCTVNADLVPNCGLLWGVAPGAYTDLPASRALEQFESATGRPADVLHAYHRGDEVFPTKDEIATVSGPRKRILFANWKVAWGTTWAKVAAGAEDGRIDKAAGRLKAFPGKMFLAIHHEPENDVNPGGGGMTAKDYAAMFRHTVERLRADGVTNVVFVMVYMAYEPWCVQPWFGDLWPGDDVVDWVGMDPYLFAKPGGYGHGDFAYLVNRTSNPSKWPGFYTWVTRTHGNKPLMVAEWGVYEYPADPQQKAWIFSTVNQQIGRFPKIKALVYFDSPSAPKGDTRPDSTSTALEEFKSLAESALFGVSLG